MPLSCCAQGLGDSGQGWKPVADQLKIDPDIKHVKWVLPHAYALSINAQAMCIILTAAFSETPRTNDHSMSNSDVC
jgi:hypothetical protein